MFSLVGRSHSEHWLGAVIKAAEENDYRVINITRSGTRFSTGYKKNTLQDDWVKNVENYCGKSSKTLANSGLGLFSLILSLSKLIDKAPG